MPATNLHCPLAEIAATLRAHRRFVVMSHVRPDGDAIGCAVALALSLRALGKEVVVWNHDGPLEKLAFLPGSELITKPPKPDDEKATGEQANATPVTDTTFDVAVALDTSTQERLGDALAAARGAKLWVNIDHHVSNPGYGDLVHIDPDAPAAGQIVFELIRAGGLPLDRAIAENLWAAIATDTGSFQYANTTARTLEIAAELVHAGVDVGRMSEQLFQTQPRRRLALLRAVLNGLKFSADGQVASYVLRSETVRELGAGPEDTEGLIDTLRGIEGVRVAVFLEETEHSTRVSMRSKDPRYDVSKLCAHFGGGGHVLAAGTRITRLKEPSQEQPQEQSQIPAPANPFQPTNTPAASPAPAPASASGSPLAPTPVEQVEAAVLRLVTHAIEHP